MTREEYCPLFLSLKNDTMKVTLIMEIALDLGL